MTGMLAFGAGVNSVAMAILLIEQGWRGPIVFTDPGAEHPDTYCYLSYFQGQYLNQHDVTITRIGPGSPYHKRSSLALEDFCLQQGMIPLLAVRWCSVEWKRTPLQGWAREHGHSIHLMGISADEPRRVRDDPCVRYPLIEAGITRPECVRIIQRAGLEVPRKSGCWFCPGQPLSQWRDLYLAHRELYNRAVNLEKNATEHAGRRVTLDPSGKHTLRELAEGRWQGQTQMDFSQWLPCSCRL